MRKVACTDGFGVMTTERKMDLIEQLRAAGKGTEEWRVADPTDGSYCIAFSRADFINPEREAREWLEDHRKRFPDSQKANYEVRRVMAQNNSDLAMCQAADELERMRETLQGIAKADWRNWEELASPHEFVRWAKARAMHALTPNA